MQITLVDSTDDAVLESGTSLISVQEARALVRHFADVTTSRDPDAFVAGFTEDSVTWFPPQPLLHGRQALRDFMAGGLAAFGDDFVCTKSLRTINGNVLGVSWVNTWKHRRSGEPMRARGVEFWILRDGRIARWDCAQVAWKDKP